jgi:2-polyprenyl-3-methyl-5-hydroxy-6-metoxy-1,4-benzoquinol methylase
MTEKYDPLRFEQLLQEQYARFPSISLPPEFAELLEENTLQLLIKLARYKFAARLLKAQDRVLDVGSGNGIGAIFLAQHVRHVTGLEIDPRGHEASRKVNRRANVEFRLQSVFDRDLNDRYDAVVSLDVIEHLSVEEGRKLVARLARLCAADGMVIIGTPSIHSHPYQGKYSQAAHIKCYDQNELVALMDSCFGRTLAFSMNDEIVHTGHPKLAWYYIVLGLLPRTAPRSGE